MSSSHTAGALPILLGNQARASGPDAHVWLSASAGTGKTQVLAARVYRLLLGGTDPGAILCLTFTKAGAAEMAGRINSRLAAWVRMPEMELRKDLHALGEDWQQPGLIARARTLFARVLDAPGGGIRIQTIHSFCQSLLASFPAEAGLSPGFRPLEAREEAMLAREALAEMLVDAEREGRGALIEAIAGLSKRSGEEAAESFLLACARKPDAMAALPGGIAPFLRSVVGLPLGDIEAVIAAALTDDMFDTDPVYAIAAANRGWGTKTGLETAAVAEAWLAADPVERAATLDRLSGLVLTKDGKLRSVRDKLLALEPDYPSLAEALAEQCAVLADKRRLAAFVDMLAPVLAAGRDYADVYRRAKRRLGAVDFDDLIRATVNLLSQPGMGDWVRYKLDQVTDHILVDEAQDTNNDQWAIIGRLAEEFFAGAGAAGDKTRTLFVVGDFKQAIFGFQGTSPLYFARAEREFRALALAARDEQTGQGTAFHRLSLTHSFRSTRPVLEFVDAAIAAVPAPGLGPIDALEAHASEVKGPGVVSLWPLVTAGGSDEDEEDWIGDATRHLATMIARQVRDWLNPANPLILESKGRALRPEDVMILVKRRGELAALIVARLYAEGVSVAGIDRLRLNAPLAVQDLLAAVRFVLQPDDDLSLANLLVSPLTGWTHDELMAAAIRPRHTGLWRHLRDTQPEARLAALYAMLARADITTPYRFLEDLLSGPLDGRRKLLRRLGEEARDPIDELLGAALQFEALATPSLQGFLDWFDRGEVEIKRDPSQPLDAVRVMTAHASKGLQAPLVILADATVDPGRSPRSILNWSPNGAMPGLPILRPGKAERAGPFVDLIEDADARELEEHWRLFYVAATRAEERLVIAGALGPRARGVAPPMSWYAVSQQAFAALGVSGDGALDYHGQVPQAPVKAPRVPVRGDGAVSPLSDWARRPAPVEARPPRPLAPSSLGEDDVADPPPTPALRNAARRGQLIHALFERLPGVDPSGRRAAAEHWLANSAGVADAVLRRDVTRNVLDVLEDPRFADLFGADALAEAPVAAVIEGGLVVSGTVDRLLVGPGHVRLIDFKTSRRPPTTVDELPAAHIRQMAAYVAALGIIFPDRRVEAALLYTAGPILFDLPPDLLAAHKPGLGTDQQSLGLAG